MNSLFLSKPFLGGRDLAAGEDAPPRTNLLMERVNKSLEKLSLVITSTTISITMCLTLPSAEMYTKMVVFPEPVVGCGCVECSSWTRQQFSCCGCIRISLKCLVEQGIAARRLQAVVLPAACVGR